MCTNFKPQESAPVRQLSRPGTKSSYDMLLKATQNLSDNDIVDLENELNFYTQTGLVGLRMSKFLVLLQMDAVAEAA